MALTKLEMDFANLKYRWKLFYELFESDDNVKILNDSSNHVFEVLQSLMLDDVRLSICRINDREKSMGKENNSLKYHLQKRKNGMSSEKFIEIQDLIKCLDCSMANIKSHRNWEISHSDLEVSQKNKALPKVTYDNIDECINLIGQALNKIFDTHGDYVSTTVGRGPSYLINILRLGLDQSSK